MNFDNDIFFEKIVSTASTHTSLYGPIFNQFASLYTATAGDSLILNLYLFKFMNMFLFLLGGYLIFKITDRDIKSLYLYLWNPFMIFITIIDVHNEIYWIVMVLAGLLLVKRHQQSFSGFIFLCMSVFTKFFSIVLLPFWIYYQIRGLWFTSKIRFVFV